MPVSADRRSPCSRRSTAIAELQRAAVPWAPIRGAVAVSTSSPVAELEALRGDVQALEYSSSAVGERCARSRPGNVEILAEVPARGGRETGGVEVARRPDRSAASTSILLRSWRAQVRGRRRRTCARRSEQPRSRDSEAGTKASSPIALKSRSDPAGRRRRPAAQSRAPIPAGLRLSFSTPCRPGALELVLGYSLRASLGAGCRTRRSVQSAAQFVAALVHVDA